MRAATGRARGHAASVLGGIESSVFEAFLGVCGTRQHRKDDAHCQGQRGQGVGLKFREDRPRGSDRCRLCSAAYAAAVPFLLRAADRPSASRRPSREAVSQGDRGLRRPVAGVRPSIDDLTREIRDQLSDRFDVELVALTVEADWTAEGVERQLDAAYSDPKISVVFGFGHLTVRAVAKRKNLPKPTILPYVFEAAAARASTAGRRQRQNETSATSARSSTSRDEADCADEGRRLQAHRASRRGVPGAMLRDRSTRTSSASCSRSRRSKPCLLPFRTRPTASSFRRCGSSASKIASAAHGASRGSASEHRDRSSLARPGRHDVDPLAEQLPSPGAARSAQPRPDPRRAARGPDPRRLRGAARAARSTWRRRAPSASARPTKCCSKPSMVHEEEATRRTASSWRVR